MDDKTILDFKTICKLTDLGTDAIGLYLVYLVNAMIQKTNCININNDYCRTKLKIGRTRFYNAKMKLEQNNLIKPEVGRDEKGRITKHYIKGNFI